MTTKNIILARRSKIGHYGIQYPDFDAAGIVVPAGAKLSQQVWIGGNDLVACSWLKENDTTIVWIKKEDLV